MGETKIVKITMPQGEVEDAALSEEFRQGKKIGRARMGTTHIFWRSGLRQYALPLEKIDRAFQRVEPVQAKLCCGRANFDIRRLILCSGGREVGDLEFEDERQILLLLRLLQEARPDMAIGVERAQA